MFADPDSVLLTQLATQTKQKYHMQDLLLSIPTWSRSFMPQTREVRQKIAKMKLMPITDLIEVKDFYSVTIQLFVAHK